MRDDIRRSIDLYASEGVPLGHFLTAVMEHDLFEAFARADEENARDMREIVRYIHWEVPASCHGSRERVRAWIDKHRPVALEDDMPAHLRALVCPGCNQEIDPETCGCGASRVGHGDPMDEGHSFVPMGCDCARGEVCRITHRFVSVPSDPSLCRCGELRAHRTHADAGVTPDERAGLGVEG